MAQNHTPKLLEKLFLHDEDGVTEAYLIRHAETDYGDSDTPDGTSFATAPLTAWGRRQAAVLAARLARIEFDAIVASSLTRARETAEALADGRGMHIHEVHELREIGLLRGDISPVLPQTAREFYEQDETMRELLIVGMNWEQVYPGSESSDAFRTRCVAAVDGLIEQWRGSRIAIVCHGGVINAYLGHLLRIPRDMFFVPANTSISIVRGIDRLRTVQRMNDSAHLERLTRAHAEPDLVAPI